MKEALLKLEGIKKIEINLDVRVKNINYVEELDFIEIDVEDPQFLFEKLTLIKGEIYPLPKYKDILKIKELFLNYDNYFSLRLFAKAEIKSTFDNNIIIETSKSNISFSDNEIIESLKNILNIKQDMYSAVFKIDSIKEKDYDLLCLSDLKKYRISKDIIPDSLPKDEYIFVANYFIEENENKEVILKKNNLTIIMKLNEEKLFQIYYKKKIFGNQLELFKVIDEKEKFYIVLNTKKEIYQIEKKKLKNLEIKICKLLLIIDDYKFIYNYDTNLKELFLDINSIIYISKQDIYFSRLIHINFLTVIHVNFLDYDLNNYYNKIIIDGKEYIINDKDFYYVIIQNKDNEYYNIEIGLQRLNDKAIEFNFILYKGLLNEINAFINYFSESSYFLEFYFMSVDIPIREIDTEISIKVNEKTYKLEKFDSFSSQNRKRFNVLNAPFQKIKNFDEEILLSKKINSIKICKIFKNKKGLLFGIFDIKEISLIEKKTYNTSYDEYYEDFGDIISIIEDKKFNLKNKKDICVKRYNESNIEKSEEVLKSSLGDEINLSQYKTRVGLILCYYIYKCNNDFEIDDVITLFNSINSKFSLMNLTFSQKLRIIIFFLGKKINDPYSLGEIIYFPGLSPNSPYILARDLNKNEINNLTEFSRLFCAYLQIDSYILYNYLKSQKSYSFSLELLFIMKFILLSNYEDFIFTTKENSDEFAYNTTNENITVINEANVFTNNFKTIKNVDDIEESKNLAFPLSMEFRHEKNSHQKRNIKNKKIYSPFLFYRDGNFFETKEEHKIENNSVMKGEAGRMVESYLDTNNSVILELKICHIFGELLDYKYFIGKDFSVFITKMNSIKESKLIKKDPKREENCKVFDKKENIQTVNKEEIYEKWTKKLEKEGIIRFGDLHYTKYEFKQIFENSSKK